MGNKSIMGLALILFGLLLAICGMAYPEVAEGYNILVFAFALVSLVAGLFITFKKP